MRICKTKVANLNMSYAVSWLNCDGKLKAVAASEGKDRCIVFNPDHPEEQECVWTDEGGTMSISQIGTKGEFLAVQNFFKGFNSAGACIVKARPGVSGGWSTEK